MFLAGKQFSFCCTSRVNVVGQQLDAVIFIATWISDLATRNDNCSPASRISCMALVEMKHGKKRNEIWCENMRKAKKRNEKWHYSKLRK